MLNNIRLLKKYVHVLSALLFWLNVQEKCVAFNKFAQFRILFLLFDNMMLY